MQLTQHERLPETIESAINSPTEAAVVISVAIVGLYIYIIVVLKTCLIVTAFH